MAILVGVLGALLMISGLGALVVFASFVLIAAMSTVLKDDMLGYMPNGEKLFFISLPLWAFLMIGIATHLVDF